MQDPERTANTPAPMNRDQADTLHAIAEKQIVDALTDYARQLPDGMRYLQEAINGAGAVLDQLERRTGLYVDAAHVTSDVEPNPDLAPRREALRGVEETTEIIDFDSGG